MGICAFMDEKFVGFEIPIQGSILIKDQPCIQIVANWKVASQVIYRNRRLT